jgi:release factor glutamine methyltransferase
VADRIVFQQSDGLSQVGADVRFDLVVSNPPYIPSAEIETLDPEVRDHDPRLALDGGPDGLTFYRRLASELGPVLHPEGLLLLEFGDGQADAVSQVLAGQKWVVDAVYPDYSARARMLAARRG